jgi:hypothetical protein
VTSLCDDVGLFCLRLCYLNDYNWITFATNNNINVCDVGLHYVMLIDLESNE